MMKPRKLGGYSLSPHYKERRQGSVDLSPSRLPILMKGGLRWNNTSEIGGVMYG